MYVLIRCTRGEDDYLYVRKGKLSNGDRQRAAKHFKKATGGKVSPVTGIIDDPTGPLPSIIHINNNLCPGIVCPLYSSTKVYFRGPANPLVVFIGEAPGVEEEKYRSPFVGRSGEVLETLRFQSGFKDEECTYLNILQCHPPNNRNPSRIESVCCSWRLFSLLEKMQPKGIVFVGKVAASFFHPVYKTVSEPSILDVNIMKTMDFGVVRFLHIRHPSYILRRGGLESKSNKELVKDTIFSLSLLRDLLRDRKRDAPKKITWSWREKHPLVIRHEIALGKQLTVRTDR